MAITICFLSICRVFQKECCECVFSSILFSEPKVELTLKQRYDQIFHFSFQFILKFCICLFISKVFPVALILKSYHSSRKIVVPILHCLLLLLICKTVHLFCVPIGNFCCLQINKHSVHASYPSLNLAIALLPEGPLLLYFQQNTPFLGRQ